MKTTNDVAYRQVAMSIAKTCDFLEKNGPLHYEIEYPIRAIERVIELGLVETSEPYRKLIQGRWRIVRDVVLREQR